MSVSRSDFVKKKGGGKLFHNSAAFLECLSHPGCEYRPLRTHWLTYPWFLSVIDGLYWKDQDLSENTAWHCNVFFGLQYFTCNIRPWLTNRSQLLLIHGRSWNLLRAWLAFCVCVFACILPPCPISTTSILSPISLAEPRLCPGASNETLICYLNMEGISLWDAWTWAAAEGAVVRQAHWEAKGSSQPRTLWGNMLIHG